MGKLDEKVALITGAGSGIGRATARLFSKEGARVCVVDCSAEAGKDTVESITKAGGEAVFIECDVARTSEIEAMVKQTAAVFGGIDILFNNAGIQGVPAPTAVQSLEDWELVLRTNLTSVFLASKHVLPLMVEAGSGIILNTSSTMGLGGRANMAPYCVSKAGIIALTKTMAAEYGKRNIRVNCICPGIIDTPLSARSIAAIQMEYIPQGRAGQAEDIAGAALYLASADSAYVSGIALVVDGGWTAEIMLPLNRPADREGVSR